MKISGFEPAICIEEFCYCLKADEHENCRFLLLVAEKNVDSCLGRMGQACLIEDDCLKFNGAVTSVSVTRGMDCCRVEVVVQGRTLEFDQEPKCRVYQSGDKTFSDILRNTSMSEVHAPNSIIPEVLVQDHETDWEFVKRIARYTEKHIFPGQKMWIGDPLDETVSIDDDDIIEMRLTLNSSKSEIRCRLRNQLKLGEKTRLSGKEFFVDAVTYGKYNEEYVFEYHLSECACDGQYRSLPAYSLPAKVQDNRDPDKMGRVKLEYLEPYEDVMKEQAVWTECGSLWASKGFGLVCIPLIGDVVQVLAFDKQVRVLSSRRVEALDGRFESPDTRYLLVGEHTHLSLDDNLLTLDNSKFKCELSDEKVRLNLGERVEIELSDQLLCVALDQSKIRIEGGKITFSTDKTDMELSGGTKFVTQGFEVDGKDHAAITASKVSIKGKSGVSIN